MEGGAQARHPASGAGAGDRKPARAGDGEGAGDPGPITVWKGYRLNPFQVRAVEALRGGHDVLVSAPTGAGKTLIAEYAIEDAVARGRRCIYTAPIKALSNQKFRDFRDDPHIEAGLLTGDVTLHPDAQVLIMTTEILRNSIFDHPQHLAGVDYVVFDEVHYMDDAERGSVWEESLIFAPRSIRFISLSATIANLDELGAWLREVREREVVTIFSARRPVPLEHRLYSAASGVFPPARLERVRKHEARSGRRSAPGGRRGERRRRGHGQLAARSGDVESPDAGPLLDELQERGQLPALVFAFSRKDCERLAGRNAHRELLDAREARDMEALQLELIRLFQLGPEIFDGELLAMARRGVAYHHAGLLPVHKEIVERMFTSGLLKLLFTTETFALGINMPARAVVFHSLRKFDGERFDYMRTREYLQMAGRAGRQGLDEVGLVYTLLSPRDLREAPLQRILSGRPEPIESRFRLSFSSLLHLVGRMGRARVGEAWEKSFNQFQHRSTHPKAERRNRREQRRLIDAHLALLDGLGYLDGDEILAKGRIARAINGFELQVTELLFGGQLEHLPPSALALVFVGLVYEERRREPAWVPQRMFGGLRAQIDEAIDRLVQRAADFGLAGTIKRPDWGLTPAVLAWIGGATMEELREQCDATPGDLCRAFRMAIQLMRQARRAIDSAWDLAPRLEEAGAALNRDEVDARRQLELG
jgi:superfamily II RNA helicase